MLIAVFAFGILAQAEAFLISSNITDATDGPSVSPLRVETEEITPYPARKEGDPMLNIITTLYSDISNSSSDVSSVLLTETNATIFPKTNNSFFNETDTLLQSKDIFFPKAKITVSPETSTTGFPDDSTIVFPKVTTSKIPEVNTENPLSNCLNIGGTQVAGSVVKCYCQGNEIYVNGTCQVHDGVIVIPVQRDWIYISTKEVNVTSYYVTVQDVNCDTSKYICMNFTKNRFYLRPRGDVILLKETGKLEGQRINNYCISHHLDEYDDLTWTMKACVPIPSVPRCCPPGKAMKEGKCEVANTPDVLKPPISAKPFSGVRDWGSITEYHSPVKCGSEYEQLITIPLGHKQSHLVSLADGVENVWVPGDTDKRRVYYKCPEYCVDGIKNSAGSVDYFTSFCYSDPMEIHRKACAKGTCLRKCCKYGYSMDRYRNGCVPDPNSTFNPPTEADLSNYIIVIGWPLCSAVHKLKGENLAVDTMGRLNLSTTEFRFSDFCVDTFIGNEHRQEIILGCHFGKKFGHILFPFVMSSLSSS